MCFIGTIAPFACDDDSCIASKISDKEVTVVRLKDSRAFTSAWPPEPAAHQYPGGAAD